MSERTKEALTKRFWGRMGALQLPMRITALLFVMVTIAAMLFCQLGFWSIGVVDGKPVYLLLLLGPLVMGAFMYGPITGALLGLYTAVIVSLHTMAIPLDYYEVYFMTPFNTFVLITVIGALSGLLFDLALHRNPKGIAKFVLIALVCIVVSFAASGLMMLGMLIDYGGPDNLDFVSDYFFNSPLGIAVQALIDAALMVLLCYGVDLFMRKAAARSGARKLISIFCNWMLIVAATVFILSCGVVFTVASISSEDDALADMLSDVDYLAIQVDSLEGSNYDILLDGYSPELDGYVTIVDKNGTILATDDDRHFPVGESVLAKFGGGDDSGFVDNAEGEKSPSEAYLDTISDSRCLVEAQAVDENGELTLDYLFIVAGKTTDGFTVAIRTTDMVYADRLGIMASITLLTALLVAAVAILAIVLLNRVVVRRIDETNASLEKTTDGDLDERVDVRDSHEFISLSKGINATVSALKDTIHEVEQRNAQDLATAKAIQESALPRMFPPFPDIKSFDIFASMKAAKEVGGDFYDFFLIEGNADEASRLGFVMADVSGKGIPAALFMMTAKTQIRNNMEAGLPVNEAVNAANHQLCDGNDAGMFVTAWIGSLDYNTGALSFVNAGHNPPLLRHNGQWEWIRDVSGMPLGLFDGIPYDRYERQLFAGDALFAYTDGVTEAMDVEGNLFGEDRLLEALSSHGDAMARIICEEIACTVTDHADGAEQSDDITMLSLRFGVAPE